MASFSSATATALASLPAFFFFIFGSSMSKLFWWGGTLLTFVQKQNTTPSLISRAPTLVIWTGQELHALGCVPDLKLDCEEALFYCSARTVLRICANGTRAFLDLGIGEGSFWDLA